MDETPGERPPEPNHDPEWHPGWAGRWAGVELRPCVALLQQKEPGVRFRQLWETGQSQPPGSSLEVTGVSSLKVGRRESPRREASEAAPAAGARRGGVPRGPPGLLAQARRRAPAAPCVSAWSRLS